MLSYRAGGIRSRPELSGRLLHCSMNVATHIHDNVESITPVLDDSRPPSKADMIFLRQNVRNEKRTYRVAPKVREDARHQPPASSVRGPGGHERKSQNCPPLYYVRRRLRPAAAHPLRRHERTRSHPELAFKTDLTDLHIDNIRHALDDLVSLHDCYRVAGNHSGQGDLASDYRFTNDAKEFLHGLEIFQKVLKSCRPTPRMSEILDIIRDYKPRLDFCVLLASFCIDPDLLSQWRGYNGGAGYALGIDGDWLNRTPKNKDSTWCQYPTFLKNRSGWPCKNWSY